MTDGLFSKSILFGGLLLALFLLILMSVKCKNFPESYSPIKNFSVTAAAILAGAAVILKSVYEIYEIAVLGVQGASGTFTDGHPAFSVVLSILGLIAAMMFFVIAGNFGSGRNTFQSLPLLALVIPLWHCYNLIIQFVSTVSGASVAENALEVLTLVFALLFLFFQAELFVGMNPARAVRRCFLFGLSAVLFAMLSSFPVCMMRALQIPVSSSFSLILHIANLCIAIYIFAFLLALTRAAYVWAKVPDLDPAFGNPNVLAEKTVDRFFPPNPQQELLPEKPEPLAVADPEKMEEGELRPEPAAKEMQAEPPQPKSVSIEPEMRISFQDIKQDVKPEDPVQEPLADARRARIDRLYETLMQERKDARSPEKKS